jgi:hypothetical protein
MPIICYSHCSDYEIHLWIFQPLSIHFHNSFLRKHFSMRGYAGRQKNVDFQPVWYINHYAVVMACFLPSKQPYTVGECGWCVLFARSCFLPCPLYNPLNFQTTMPTLLWSFCLIHEAKPNWSIIYRHELLISVFAHADNIIERMLAVRKNVFRLYRCGISQRE